MTLKKHKMLAEFVEINETEYGAISSTRSVKFMGDISKLAKKHGFVAYAKGYPKDVLDYEPTGQTIHIKTVEDIAKLTLGQFEMFIDDLRNFCRTMQACDMIEGLGMKVHHEPGMVWIDSGLHETNIKVTTEITNKL